MSKLLQRPPNTWFGSVSISSCTVLLAPAQETVVIDVKQSFGITLGGLNRALDSARYSGVYSSG